MDRKVVEALLARCEKFPGDELRLVNQSALATLCRTQLAVWDAPVVDLRPDSETYRGVQVDTQNSARIVVDMGQALNIGQRARLVPEGE